MRGCILLRSVFLIFEYNIFNISDTVKHIQLNRIIVFHIFYLCESSCDQRLNNMHETNRCIERYWNKECANDIDVEIDGSKIRLLFVVLIFTRRQINLLCIFLFFTLNIYVFIIGTSNKWQSREEQFVLHIMSTHVSPKLPF